MKVRNFVLGIAILIVYALALWQGIQAFYPSPEYEDFCSRDDPIPRPVGSGVECEFPSEVDTKSRACSEAGGLFRYEYDGNGCVADGFCDECLINYDEARDNYSRNIFIISFIVGILTFIVGLLILKVEPVGSSLLASGVWAIFYGTVWNWRNFGNLIKFLLLLVVLIALIFIALKLNSRKKGFFRKIFRK